VDHFIRNEQIVFDGIYSRVQALKRTDEYFNYNQIYADFDLLDLNEFDEITCEVGSKNVEQKVVIISPISLTNEDLKQKDDFELLVQASHDMEEDDFESKVCRPLTIKGLPIES
jgi:hypothetical protein